MARGDEHTPSHRTRDPHGVSFVSLQSARPAASGVRSPWIVRSARDDPARDGRRESEHREHARPGRSRRARTLVVFAGDRCRCGRSAGQPSGSHGGRDRAGSLGRNEGGARRRDHEIGRPRPERREELRGRATLVCPWSLGPHGVDRLAVVEADDAGQQRIREVDRQARQECQGQPHAAMISQTGARRKARSRAARRMPPARDHPARRSGGRIASRSESARTFRAPPIPNAHAYVPVRSNSHPPRIGPRPLPGPARPKHMPTRLPA